MATYRDRALVLRTHKLGESDRIITLLTRSHGKVRAVARGVRRTSSKFGARLEPFSHIDAQFAIGRSLDVVTQCDSVQVFGAQLVDNYQAYTAGEVMLETVDRLVSIEKEPALQQYRLLIGALWALAFGTTDGPRPATMILDSFLLRSLSIAGYAPSLTKCAKCGSSQGQKWFSPPDGGAACRECRKTSAVIPSQGAWALLSALLTGDWLATAQADAHTQREVSGIVAAFTNWHLDQSLRSLPLVDRRGLA